MLAQDTSSRSDMYAYQYSLIYLKRFFNSLSAQAFPCQVC